MTQRMQFVWTVNLGQVLQFGGLLLGAASIYYGLVYRVERTEEHVRDLRVQIEALRTTNASSIDKFQSQVNLRMDAFSGTLTALSVSMARTETNVEALIRSNGGATRPAGGR